ncbi:hypothetical protein AB5I41_22740 [Sphingomonas sp. MMS24-JH45]
MVDDADDLAALTARTIRHHVAAIGAHAVVRVRVAPIDFPGAADLQDLAVADAALASGEARLDLRLGEADLDLRSPVGRSTMRWRETGGGGVMHATTAAIAATRTVRPTAGCRR